MNLKLNWLAKSKNKNQLDLIRLLLLFFIIFTSSLNLFYKLSLDGVYVHGLLVDYLIPKFYLAELFLLPFLVLEWRQFAKVKIQTYFCLLLLLLIIRQLLSQNHLAAFTHFLHVSEVVLFFTAVKNDPLFKKDRAQNLVLGALLTTVLFQSILAIYQFIFQKSFLPYQISGETNLRDFANISKAQFLFAEKILPYGTTPHPNILAGLVVIFSIILINHSDITKKLKIALIANALLIIFLTQSVSALLTLLLFFAYLFLQKIKAKGSVIFLIYYLFLLLFPYALSKLKLFNNSNSIQRRVALNQASLAMFQDKPILGVGINNFTPNLEKYDAGGLNKEVVRFVQPVHNLLFLILSEGGLLLLTVVLLLIEQAKIKQFYRKTIILLAIASLDHYLFSQFVGLNILALFYLFI